MQNFEFIDSAAEMLRVMGHPLRIRIALVLEANGEMGVSQLAEALGAPQSTTSQHLKAMRLHEMVRARREGNNVYYSLFRPEVFKILECLRESQARAEAANQPESPPGLAGAGG